MGIKLNMFEETKYKAIKTVCHGQLLKEPAEVNRDLSRRQINWLANAYTEIEEAAFQHRNYQRKPRSITF